MSKSIDRVLNYWLEISTVLRRYPLLDYVQAAVLILFGLASLLHPHSVLHGSHFGRLGASVGIAGILALASGSHQCVVARLHHRLARTIAAFGGLWVMSSLWFAVDSITGKIAWGGHVVIQLLICLALVP